VALQELDQSTYWLELLIESEIAARTSTHALLQEADELIRILVSIVRKTKGT
jgi:four helix bundle protein